MSWAVGYDEKWKRDIGYGVPAFCDHPGCKTQIDRGLSYVCCDNQPYGGEGCGLYFCEDHIEWNEALSAHTCKRCAEDLEPFDPSPDHPDWINWKLTDESWAPWRAENPDAVAMLTSHLESKT